MATSNQDTLYWQDELDALGPYAEPDQLKALLARAPADADPELVDYVKRVSSGEVMLP